MITVATERIQAGNGQRREHQPANLLLHLGIIAFGLGSFASICAGKLRRPSMNSSHPAIFGADAGDTG